jgi:hypothetical protein
MSTWVQKHGAHVNVYMCSVRLSYSPRPTRTGKRAAQAKADEADTKLPYGDIHSAVEQRRARKNPTRGARTREAPKATVGAILPAHKKLSYF